MAIQDDKGHFLKAVFIKRTAVGFCIGFLMGIGAVHLFMYRDNSAALVTGILRPIQLGREGLVNQLLAYAVPENVKELKSLKEKLQKEIDEEKSRGFLVDAGIYFRDLDSAWWSGINETEKFSPASLLKVPLMISYYKLTDSDSHILNRRLTYDGSFDDNELENIKPLKSIRAGNSYTIDELIKYMIAYSDNNATHLLYDALPRDAFAKTYTDLGLSVPSSTDDFLGPRSYSLFFRILYNVTYLKKDMSQKALEELSQLDFPQGLSSGIPEDVKIVQKFGEHQFSNGVEELHDCGIVYHLRHPYFLCVMTKGHDFGKLSGIIRNVSKIVYKEVDSDYKN